MEQWYHVLLIVAMVIITVLIIFSLVRSVSTKEVTGRIVSVNLIGTLTVAMIFLLTIFLKNDQLLDVNLIYALINFMAVVILAKIYAGSGGDKN